MFSSISNVAGTATDAKIHCFCITSVFFLCFFFLVGYIVDYIGGGHSNKENMTSCQQKQCHTF